MLREISIEKISKNLKRDKPACFFCFKQKNVNIIIMFPELGSKKFTCCDDCYKHYTSIESGADEMFIIAKDFIMQFPVFETNILLGNTEYNSLTDFYEKTDWEKNKKKKKK